MSPPAGRPDLLALGPEALGALANPGLVKRARKENLASPPVVEELPDGLVVGTFADGSVARLPVGTSLRDSPCTCGAVGVCRHRVALVLAYASAAAPQPAAVGILPTDLEIDLAFGAARVAAARAALARPWPAEVALTPVPTVRFDTCAVRFLAGADPGHARCDCASEACVHVILAVWALREAPSGGSITLGAPLAAAESASLAPAVDLVERLLLDGLAHGVGHAPAFARLAASLGEARRAWPAAILEELGAQLEGYAQRHARHDPAVAAGLCAELVARARAAAGGAPADAVLGAGLPAETALDTVRLVGLGARVDHDGARCLVEVYLADPDAGVALVLPVRWALEPGEAPADRVIAPGVTLGRLAAGQVVSKKASRRPDREVRLGGGRHTSVLAQTGAWDALPDALRADRISAWAARARPPRLVGPRVRARDLVAVRVHATEGVRWAPGAQELRAVLRDVDGEPMRLVVPWRAVAPNAVDAVAEALPRVTWVAGVLGPGRTLVPTALVAGGVVVVPDLAGPTIAPRLPLDGPSTRSALDAALREAEDALSAAAHHGLLVRDADRRALDAAAALDRVGLAAVAGTLRAWAAATRAGRLDPARARAAASAWATAAIRVALAREGS